MRFLVFGLILIANSLILVSCKESKSNFTSPSTEQIVEKVGNVTLNNVPESTILVVDQQMSTSLSVGTKIFLKWYLTETGFPSFAKIIKTENNREYLFTQYYSGGAHCCVVLEAYQFDQATNGYRYLTNYSFDGDLISMDYPFEVSDRIEYSGVN